LTRFLKLHAAYKDAYWDKQQASDEQSRKKQEEDDAQVGIRIGPAKELHQPAADHGHAGGAGNGASDQTCWVITKEQSRPCLVFKESLEQWSLRPSHG